MKLQIKESMKKKLSKKNLLRKTNINISFQKNNFRYNILQFKKN